MGLTDKDRGAMRPSLGMVFRGIMIILCISVVLAVVSSALVYLVTSLIPTINRGQVILASVGWLVIVLLGGTLRAGIYVYRVMSR